MVFFLIPRKLTVVDCLIFFPSSEPWLLSIGNLQLQCKPTGEDGVDSLAVSRGLLTCCQPHVLLSPHTGGKQVSPTQVFKYVVFLLL